MSFWKRLFGAKDSPKAGPTKAVNDVALTALLSKDGTEGAAHERTSTQPLYSGPTFKMLLMSVSRSDMFLPFIQMAASQTGIVPKDIPEDKNWIKENLLWYERNPCCG